MRCQVTQQFDFALGQFVPSAFGKPDLPAGEIGAAVRNRERLDIQRALRRTAEHGFDAGQQLFDAERFDDVIVRSALQSRDAVVLLAPRRQNDDGQCGADFPDSPQNLQSVGSGQHQVQQQQIEVLFERHRQAFVPASALEHGETGKPQRIHHAPADGRIVFDRKNRRAHHVGRVKRLAKSFPFVFYCGTRSAS
jgi:hypothetical protein